jgi:hypothetical protein
MFNLIRYLYKKNDLEIEKVLERWKYIVVDVRNIVICKH